MPPPPTTRPELGRAAVCTSAPHKRVVVQLTPAKPESQFVMALRARSKNPKLRIENVRQSKDVSMVIEHCRRRWKDHLDEIGEVDFVLYSERTGVACAPNTAIEKLCQDAGILEQGQKLTLTYEVRAAVEV